MVYLHRCTIFYLIRQGILYNKNSTNFSLYLRVRDEKVREAFRQIYLVAEMVLFDDYRANERDLNMCKELFHQNFING